MPPLPEPRGPFTPRLPGSRLGAPVVCSSCPPLPPRADYRGRTGRLLTAAAPLSCRGGRGGLGSQGLVGDTETPERSFLEGEKVDPTPWDGRGQWGTSVSGLGGWDPLTSTPPFASPGGVPMRTAGPPLTPGRRPRTCQSHSNGPATPRAQGKGSPFRITSTFRLHRGNKGAAKGIPGPRAPFSGWAATTLEP